MEITMEEHIRLQQAHISTLEADLVTANTRGDASRAAKLIELITSAKQVLTRLQAA
jgi:hypothetical protein